MTCNHELAWNHGTASHLARRAVHFLALVFTQPESWEHGKANHQTRHTTLLEHPSLFGCHHTDSSLEGSGSCLRGMQICHVIANAHQLSPILQGQYAIPCVEHGRPTGPLHLQGSLLLARFSIIWQKCSYRCQRRIISFEVNCGSSVTCWWSSWNPDKPKIGRCTSK